MDKLDKSIKNWLDNWKECSKCNDMVTMINVSQFKDVTVPIILCNECAKEESAQ